MQASTARVLTRDPVLLAVLGPTAALAAWLFTGWGPPALAVLVVAFVVPTYDLVILLTSRRLAALPGTPRAARRFWLALALLGLLFFVGDLGQPVHVLAHRGLADPSPAAWQSAWVLAGIALPVLVMLTYPQAAPTRQTRIRFWLDAGAVLTAAVVIMSYLGGSSAAQVIPQAAVALIGAFAAARLLLSGATPMGSAAATPVLAAAALQIFSGALVADPIGNRTVLLVLQIVAPALLSCGPRIQLVLARHHAGRPARRARPYSLLPYVMLAVLFALLPVALPDGLRPVAVLTLIGAAVVTTLVVVRQLVVFGEFDTLVARLDASLADARELEERLRYQTQHDSLTGLANRALFGDRLAETAAAGVAVLHIDLDGFKIINDTFGHHAGDAVLVEVAARLRASLPHGGLAARLGGDEFAVLLPGATRATAGAVADRFQALLRLPVPVDGRPLEVGASIGMVTGASGDPDDLLRRADEEMYRIKHAGRAVSPRAGVAG